MACFRQLPTSRYNLYGMELIGLAFLQLILLFCAVMAGTVCALIVYAYTRGMSRGRIVTVLVASTFPEPVWSIGKTGLLWIWLCGTRRREATSSMATTIYLCLTAIDSSFSIRCLNLPTSNRLHTRPHWIWSGSRDFQILGNTLLIEAYQGQNATDLGIDKEANHYLFIDTNTSEVTEYPNAGGSANVCCPEKCFATPDSSGKVP